MRTSSSRDGDARPALITIDWPASRREKARDIRSRAISSRVPGGKTMAAVSIRARVAPLLAFALLVPAVRAQGAVLVVDWIDGPFLTVQAAIAAAADGDTILVHAGAYEAPQVVGRSLTIAAEDGASVAFYAGLFSTLLAEVRDLAPDDVVVLRGIAFDDLRLLDNEGTVWVEDCDMTSGAPGLLVESSANVVLVRDTISGQSGFIDPGAYFSQGSSDGARFVDSRVAMYDCTVQGGKGSNFTQTVLGPGFPHIGEDAIEMHGGELRLSGCSLTGGAGGAGGSDSFYGCFEGQTGGHGVNLVEGAPALVVRDSQLAGGPGGAAITPPPPTCPFGSSGPGAAGSPVLTQSGAVTNVEGLARHVQLSGPVSEQEPLHVTVAGAPGDAVLLLVATQPQLTLTSASLGALLVATPQHVVGVGVLGVPGELDVQVRLPELGPGVEGVRLFVQGAFEPGAGGAVLGSGSVLVALDSAY
jgi:hypothetical protein